jgi:hypothetical protein
MLDLKQYNVKSDENKQKASYDIGCHFINYYEVDKYLGISILKNPLFGEAPDNVKPKDIILVASGDKNMITCLMISGCHIVSGTSAGCFFRAEILLNDTETRLNDIMLGSSNAHLYVNKDGDLTYDLNMKPEEKGISKVLSYTSARNGIESEIVVTTEIIKQKVNEDIELKYTRNTIDAYFIHENIMYSLRFSSIIYEDYVSEKAKVTYPDSDTLTTDDYVTLIKNVIDAFIVN